MMLLYAVNKKYFWYILKLGAKVCVSKVESKGVHI